MQTPGPAAAKLPAVVVTLPAEIDLSNQQGVEEELLAAVTSGAAVVIADMTGTTFADSMGIRALVLAHKQAVARGKEFRVAASPGAVLRVLSLLGLDKYFAVYPSVQEAQAAGPATDQPVALTCPPASQRLTTKPEHTGSALKYSAPSRYRSAAGSGVWAARSYAAAPCASDD